MKTIKNKCYIVRVEAAKVHKEYERAYRFNSTHRIFSCYNPVGGNGKPVGKTFYQEII
jgi:hypothetical protein